jgi:hypothetical protein
MASVVVIGLLCAGSTQYHPFQSSSRRGDHLSRAELAGLLSGLSSAQMHYALAKWALDQDAECNLLAHVRVWLADIAVREQWKVVKGKPTICNMAAIAVFEAIRPNRCGLCRGRLYVSNKVCPSCSGSGYRYLSGREIADAMSIDQSNFSRTWQSRYERVFKYLQDIDCEVKYTLGKADKELALLAS